MKKKNKKHKENEKILNICLCGTILFVVMMVISEIIGETLDLNKIITYSISVLLSVRIG